MKKVFVCSPFRGDISKNLELAKEHARFVTGCNCCPVVPHLMFPQFLNDSVPDERILAICLGVELMKCCDEVWVFGTTISKGMAYELAQARKLNIPIRMYCMDHSRIMGHTLQIDDRIDDNYRRAIRGMRMA